MIAACLKWVDHRPAVDPLTGEVHTDARTSGPSGADLAALEWALVLAEAWGTSVVAVTAGSGAAEPMLRDAVAAGAARAIRVETVDGAPSEEVAEALDAALPDEVDTVVCGDWSLDRGSGAVPAFLAARLGAAQALGLVTLAPVDGVAGTVTAERRLDGGRRERLRLSGPMVLSVEAASARLRRAPLDGVLRAKAAAIETVEAPTPTTPVHPPVHRRSPYRPRARALPPPPAILDARQRTLALTGALVEHTPPQRLVLEPGEAADRLLEQLKAWGYQWD